MLSRVHGPLDVTWMDGSPLTTSVPNGLGMWIDGWGMSSSFYAFEVDLVTPDAKAVRIGCARWMVAHKWSQEDEFVLTKFNNNCYRADFPSLGPVDDVTYAYIHGHVILPDRSLSFDGDTIRGWAIINNSDNGSPGVIEARTYGSQANGGTMFPADAKSSKWWCCNYNTGRVVMYDAVARQIVPNRGGTLPKNGLTFRCVGYSQSLKLFVTLCWDAVRTCNVMNYYCEEPVAATVSAPVFSAAPRAGSLRTVKARVLGDDSEPCAGRIVTFSTDAGTIAVPSVETGIDGWAETDYLSPMSVTNGATVTATLVE